MTDIRLSSQGEDDLPGDLLASSLPDAAAPQVADELRAHGVAVLLLDCMGFTQADKRVASEASGLPVTLSNALVAKLASENL